MIISRGWTRQIWWRERQFLSDLERLSMLLILVFAFSCVYCIYQGWGGESPLSSTVRKSDTAKCNGSMGEALGEYTILHSSLADLSRGKELTQKIWMLTRTLETMVIICFPSLGLFLSWMGSHYALPDHVETELLANFYHPLFPITIACVCSQY